VTTVVPEPAPVRLNPAPAPLPAPAASHPTPCPSWCLHVDRPESHNFSRTDTAHRSAELLLTLPGSNGGTVLVRAELFRLDELSETGEAVLFVQGESEQDANGPAVEMLIAQLVAFTEGVSILRRQMG
jgi:hypothetical protein